MQPRRAHRLLDLGRLAELRLMQHIVDAGHFAEADPPASAATGQITDVVMGQTQGLARDGRHRQDRQRGLGGPVCERLQRGRVELPELGPQPGGLSAPFPGGVSAGRGPVPTPQRPGGVGGDLPVPIRVSAKQVRQHQGRASTESDLALDTRYRSR